VASVESGERGVIIAEIEAPAVSAGLGQAVSARRDEDRVRWSESGAGLDLVTSASQARANSTAARAWTAVESKQGTATAPGSTSSPISVQPSTIPSAPRAISMADFGAGQDG
jgi:hypothetical protein